MVKDEKVDSEKQQQKQPEKKKVIKKFPINKFKNLGKDDDVKNWKPTKIDKKDSKAENEKSGKNSIALSFLSSLPKPQIKQSQKSQKKSIFFDEDEPIRVSLLKPTAKQQLTEEQIKWDIEDQTYIRKQFIRNGKPVEKVDEAEEEEQIMVMNNKNEGVPTKVRHIDINQVINDNKKQTSEKIQRKNELWESAQGLLDGKGELANIANEAIKRSEEIEESINRRFLQKKQMRNRYGW